MTNYGYKAIAVVDVADFIAATELNAIEADDVDNWTEEEWDEYEASIDPDDPDFDSPNQGGNGFRI